MIRELDCVALREDVPVHRLKRGDVGAVVDVEGLSGPFLVEFVLPNGETQALVSLAASQIRRIPVRKGELGRWRLALDLASAAVGPRLTIEDLATRVTAGPGSPDPQMGLDYLRRLPVVDRETGKKSPRVLVYSDPILGQVLFDLKAIKRSRRRPVIEAWNQYRTAFRSLDANIPTYQQELRKLLDTTW